MPSVKMRPLSKIIKDAQNAKPSVMPRKVVKDEGALEPFETVKAEVIEETPKRKYKK